MAPRVCLSPSSGYLARAGLLALCALKSASALVAGESAEVFHAPPAAYAEAIADVARETESAALRTFSVEERTGVNRAHALVRVPLFFFAGECRSIDDLTILRGKAGGPDEPVPFQADDVRPGPDGGISRVHLWFETDLAANARESFRVVRRRSPAPAAAPVAIAPSGDELRYRNPAFFLAWSKNGALKSIVAGAASWRFGGAGAAPRVRLRLPRTDTQASIEVAFNADTAEREVAWSSGPLFAKLRVRIPGPDGSALVQEYRVPHRGDEIVVTTVLFTGSRVGVSVKDNQLLAGELGGSGKPWQVLRVPAGVRFDLRAEHAYSISALTGGPSAGALLSVPLVVGGANGTMAIDDGSALTLRGARDLQQGGEGEKDSLHAFWTEVRLIPTATSDPDALWTVYHGHVQPLVAVVDEPGVTKEHLHAALRDIAREMKPIGWRQEAGRALVLGDRARMTKIVSQAGVAKEADADALLRSAQNSFAKLTNNGARKLREDEKGRGYGRLDPYHITYTQGAAAALTKIGGAPEQVNAVNYAMAKAVRGAGGKVDSAGNPYIDCFSRTLNMQMGPVLFGLTAGAAAGDRDLVHFYRDLATSPPVQGVIGRAQRPYTGAPAKSADQTDYLYQSISDFWLRAAELLGDENLSLHPLAFARYTDCIDVMADLYHGDWAKDKAPVSVARANFFRGQAHTHRWLGWSCAPFIRLLEDPTEHATIGLTEAVRFARARKGHWKNWPDLTFYLLADLLIMDGTESAKRPELPPAPTGLETRHDGKTVELSWKPVNGATAYRVYRAEKSGGPYRLLNSPHTEPPAAAVTTTRFRDDQAPANAFYAITAVDRDGRESRWRELPDKGAPAQR